MNKRHLGLIILGCFSFYCSSAQKSFPDSSLVGLWKGSSICQIKNSACHDEIVVYHISKGTGPDLFDIAANKIVNGAEEEMGIISCKLDRKNHQLVSASHDSVWTFNLKGNNLDGTLIFKGDLYRIVKVSKQY